MNTRRFAISCSLAIWLSGCVTPFEKPDLSVEQIAPVSWTQWAGNVAEAPNSWRDFDDPILQDLIDEALANNLTLRQVRIQLESARVSSEVDFRVRQPTLFSDSAFSVGGDLDRGGTNSVLTQSLTASYEVDLWGRLSNTVRLAELGLESQEIAYDSALISLAASITDAYFAVRALDLLIELRSRSFERQQEQRKLIALRFEAGFVSLNDLDRQDVLLADLENDLEALENQRDTLVFNLAVLLGKLPQEFEIDRIPDYPLLDPPVVKIGTPLETLRHRPDIKQAEISLAASHVSAEQVRLSIYPDLVTSVSGSSDIVDFETFFDVISLPWSAALGLSLPLFDQGARKADLRLAELSLDAQVLSYRLSVLNALQDVESVLANDAALRRQNEAAQRQRVIQQRVSEQVRANFNAGRMSSLDLIQEEQNLIAIEETEVSQWQNSISNSVSLLRALGVVPRSEQN